MPPINEGPQQEVENPYSDATLTRSISPWNPNTPRGEPVTRIHGDSNATVAMPDPNAIEVTLGVEPLDVLAAELDIMSDEWARGWALYGPGGGWSDVRKAMLSAREIHIRDNWNEIKLGKMTDAKLDAEAHADPEYRKFLDRSMLERAQWILLDQARDVIHARLARGNAILRASARG